MNSGCSQALVSTIAVTTLLGCSTNNMNPQPELRWAAEIQVTRDRKGHILTNTGVWSPDGEWVVYDTRSDAAGEKFDGSAIEMAHIRTGEVRTIYRSANGAHCGVATFHPREPKVVFILGPENPAADWAYGPSRRQGLIVAFKAGTAVNLDARDLTPPFTPGALRGGSHVHVWDASGEWVSFTYEDQYLAAREPAPGRNVGVSVPGRPVRVQRDHSRNHDGEYFSALVTSTTGHPTPGSDEIKKAFEEGWIGTRGYGRPDGKWIRHALAFQGQILTSRGEIISEVFVADLPDDITAAGTEPLAGTEDRMPAPPRGSAQRRITFTADRKFPGIQGPRHWLRSSPDGSRIAFLMKDDGGIAQLWTVSPNGGAPVQLTRNPWPVASAFTWHPDGRRVACIIDHSVFIVNAATGESRRLTQRTDIPPRPEACVFSPDGVRIAYVREVRESSETFNQIFVAELRQ